MKSSSWLIRSYSFWFLAASEISSPSTLLHHHPASRHRGFLGPAYFKHACASEPCTSVPSAWHALPKILHTILQFIQVSIQMAAALPQSKPLSYYSIFLVFIFLFSVYNYWSQCAFYSFLNCIVLLYPLEFYAHESRDFILLTVGVNPSAPGMMPTTWQELNRFWSRQSKDGRI